ncbi:A/G-specific adenine glycosylase [Acidovorax sp. DW039]|uniref:A/G-specific adenine glycosylase n=1 Tax=Acidovorax sp. DW039 TaxID=3095606 RepID=UPI0030CF82B5
MTSGSETVATLVVRWQAAHGRSHLPWQQTRDPYRVWLSEIMLQQTQVATVLEYYERFLRRFPDVTALAQASQEDVMGLWSGLGYYSRARNLHKCAQVVVSQYGGRFPETVELLSGLPGIGRSTAGAIAAFCFSQRAAILDANVRRVLTRLLGFDSDLAVAKHERELWAHAEALLPTSDLHRAMPGYTQGMMDLGAVVCTPRNPQCLTCPLMDLCVARKQGQPEHYPVKTRKLIRRSESWWLLVMRRPDGSVWLEVRPSKGIWAGLHCVPVFAEWALLQDAIKTWGLGSEDLEDIEPFVHVLTHRDLHLHPIAATVPEGYIPKGAGHWFSPEQWVQAGLPAPLRKLLERLV